MKKLIAGCLILTASLPIAFMAGCGASSSPTSSNNPTSTPTAATTAVFTATPTNTATVVPAGPTALNLGAAGSASPVGSFAVLAQGALTNDGQTVCGNTGEIGAISGTAAVFTCSGASYLSAAPSVAPAVAAIFNTTAPLGAYNTALALPSPTPIVNELGALVLTPGVYGSSAFTLGSGSAMAVTLNNAGGNPNNAYIFVTSGTFVTYPGSQVVLVNVKAANVFWVVTGATTLSTGATTVISSFKGTILSYGAVTVYPQVSLEGNIYSYGAITFNDPSDTITNP